MPARTRTNRLSSTRAGRTLLAAAIAAVSAAALCTGIGPAVAATPTAQNTSQFKGVNWADPRDNYANDPVVLSGLSPSDSYAKTYAKASRIISAFRANLGANTVRMPINPYTVNGPYWKSYRGVIDAAIGTRASRSSSPTGRAPAPRRTASSTTPPPSGRCGTPSSSAYKHNPQRVLRADERAPRLHRRQWADIAAKWLATYPSVPRNRVFVSGAGYNDNVTSVCADPRLDGTYLSLHHYGFWKATHLRRSGWPTSRAASATAPAAPSPTSSALR